MNETTTRRTPAPRRRAEPEPCGPLIGADDLIDMLMNRPGMSDKELQADMDAGQMRNLSHLISRLVDEGRVTTVRFTENAPHLRTTFRYFATEHGQIEIVARDSISYAYVHDPLGAWRKAMDEAIENA